ncbi:uncharacterized protein E5676_scaffold73G00930 [Cucumis melo var. makuwa]|uniref:Uncharacterized protein n=1 Tax=Cucumis melo var. makuwa TaxID=1194695 RepID=A0A5D3CKY9_CUCMM|nr:uncharacterized protein E5676_scaffold73G00930 [Cucumis melo var. makuwa]
MSFLIPDPRSPSKKTDVYLQPLTEKLKELWNFKVHTYDSLTGRFFQLHAALLWTINELLTYGDLSRWNTKGTTCGVEEGYTMERYTTRKLIISDTEHDVGIRNVGNKGFSDAVNTASDKASRKHSFPTHQEIVGKNSSGEGTETERENERRSREGRRENRHRRFVFRAVAFRRSAVVCHFRV